MADADEPDNSGDSDTTEDEQIPGEGDPSEETPDDNDTPVIDPSEDVEEDPAEEPDEEEVVEPTVDPEDPALDPTVSVNGDEVALAAPDAPVIVLKNGEAALTSGASVPNRTSGITFEITAVDGVSFYYTLDGSAPTKESTAYSGAVTLTAPDKDEAATLTIKAVGVTAAAGEGGEDQVSDVATATVVYEAKTNTIKLDASSEEGVTIKAGTDTITAENGLALDPASDLALTVEIGEEAAKTKEIDKVQYKSADANVTEWKDAVAAANGTYTIPMADLTTDILVKASLKDMPQITFAVSEGSTYEMFTAKLTVKKGSTTIKNAELLELTKDDNKVSVPSGTVVTAVIDAKTKCQLTKVTLGDKDITIANKIKATVTVSTASEPLNANQTITITAAEEYLKAVVEPKTEGQGEAKESPAKTWTVAPRNEYTLSALKGGNGAFKIGKAECDQVDGITLTQNKESQGEGERATEVPAGTYTLAVDAAAGGKTAKVKLYAAEEDTTPVDTITIKVAPVITKVTVGGLKNGVISQIIGTEASYPLTLTTSEKTSKDELVASVKTGTDASGSVKSVEIKDNKLVVITNAVAPKADAAEIEIKNNSDTAQEKPVVATVKVTTTAPAWAEKVAPVVKLASATDIALKLSMTLPKGASAAPAEGTEYYYKVKTTAVNPKTGVTYPADGKDRYFKVNGNNATVSEVVKVIEATFGQGTDTKFNVEVQLLQYTTGTTTDPGGDGNGDGGNGDGDNGNGENPDGGEETPGGGENGGGNEGGAETTSYGDVSAYAEGDTGSTTPPADTGVDNLTPPTGGTLIASSKVATVKNLATKAPYYADKISLKKEKAASSLYTGQTAVVASIDFGKNTTYNRDEDVEVEVVDAPEKQNGDKLLTAEIEDGKVTLAADAELTPGKYTIRVSQTAGTGIPQETVPASATLQVTVVQGIYKIDPVSAPKIYVAANKTGTAKITPVYNDKNSDGVTDAKPKTAKVSYQVGKLENKQFAADADIAKKVSVKSNGTVTVLKGYEKDPIDGGKFAVQVKAADFADNEVAETVEYEVITQAEELGAIVLVAKEQSTYKKLDVTGKLAVNEIADGKATIAVLKKDVQKTDNFEEGDFAEPASYTLTFSKKKDIGMYANGEIWVNKPVDNVKVSAVTTDGGKKKATDLVFSVTYETVEGAKLQITSPQGVNFSAENKAEVTVPTGEIIKIQAVDKDDKALEGKLVDYKITTLKGAKIVTGKNSLSVGILMSGKEATVKLTNPKGSTPRDVTYTITNTNFDQPKAPKVTVAKGAKLYANNTNAQKLTFTIAKSDPVEAVKVKISAAPDEASQKLLGYISDSNKEISLANKVISKVETVDFDVNFSANMDVIKKATLYFDFIGEEGGDNDKKDVILTKTSTAVTVKTELLKKSYKLTNKYTMSAKDTAKVALTGKETGVEKVEFKSILNANIKGTVNKFKEAFKLTDSKLCLIDETKAVKDYQDGDKKLNNLIGFVKYTVTYRDGSEQEFITQLTINVKPSVRKLTSKKAVLVKEDDMAPEITVMAGKDVCGLAYAAYKDKEGTIFALDETKSYADGTVTLKLADGVKAADVTLTKKEGTLTVIPADSMYVKAWEELNKNDGGGQTKASDEDKAAFLAANAITVPVTIEPKSIDSKNKVKVDNKNKKVSFKDVTATDNTYSVEVPFTVLISAVQFKVAADRSEKNDVLVTPAWVDFELKNGENAIVVKIDKSAYAAAVRAGGKTGDNYNLNGKNVKGTALISLPKGGATDAVIFTITPPVLAAADIENAVTPPTEEKTITVTVTPDTASVEQGKTQKFEAAVKEGNEPVQGATVTWSVAAATDGNNISSNTKFNANGNDADVLTVGEDETETSLKVTATYEKGGKSVTGTATVTVTKKSDSSGGSGSEG